MKKHILFIINNLEIGGVQKSFLSLINTIDTSKYNIDVFISQNHKEYEKELPDNINILHSIKTEMAVDYFPRAIKRMIRAGYYSMAIKRCIQFLVSRIDRGYGGYLLSRLYEPIKKFYDVIIDEGGQAQLYFMVDQLRADKKISIFHSDYSQWNLYHRMDERYYYKIDYILTISEKCRQSLINYFPNFDSKRIAVMENISSPSFIRLQAEVPIKGMDAETIRLLTVGRLSYEKGIDTALLTARKLTDRGIKFHWYFLGDAPGNAKESYLAMAKKIGVDNHVSFLGSHRNPYPYIKKADIIVHPSRYEGKSIALDEIKILAKPVVVTNFSTVNDQFTNGQNATITTFDPSDIADGIIELIKNDELRNRYIDTLKADTTLDNTSQINILYELIES